MNFWLQFTKLCTEHGVSPSKVCEQIGLSNATATHWKKGAKPSNKSLKAIANYFKLDDMELAQHFFTIELIEDMKNITITDEETRKNGALLTAYNNADERTKNAIDILLGIC